MAVPDFQTIMRPLLAVHADELDHGVATVRAHVGDHFGLSEEDLGGASETTSESHRTGKSKAAPRRPNIAPRPNADAPKPRMSPNIRVKIRK